MEYPPTFEAGSYIITSSQAPSPSVTKTSRSHSRSHRTHTQYYNLHGFNNSVSLPTLPLQQEVRVTQFHNTSSTTGLSLNIPSVGSTSQVPSKPSCSPRSGVIVGISCTGSSSVVSHHHNIYVTSPVKPSEHVHHQDSLSVYHSASCQHYIPQRLEVVSACLASSPSTAASDLSSRGIADASSSSDNSCYNSSGFSSSSYNTSGFNTSGFNTSSYNNSGYSSPFQRESALKPVRRRTPPASHCSPSHSNTPSHFPPSHSNSSLESISEHGVLHSAAEGQAVLSTGVFAPATVPTATTTTTSSSSHKSGGSATLVNPLELHECTGRPQPPCGGGNGISFQHGGTSGGTVISTLGRQAEGHAPPRLVLPGPPLEPPPDD